MPHPFASLSPAEQQEQLRPAAVLPISGAVWNAAQATVEITARHHEAKIYVMEVLVPRSPTLASVAVSGVRWPARRSLRDCSRTT